MARIARVIEPIMMESSRLPCEEEAVEIVERKGLGHPDTICDAVMESVSVALPEAYLKNFYQQDAREQSIRDWPFQIVLCQPGHRSAHVDARYEGPRPTSEIKQTVLNLLGEIAPEADLMTLKPNSSFRGQLDIDSTDFSISSSPFIKNSKSTFDGCVRYLERKLSHE